MLMTAMLNPSTQSLPLTLIRFFVIFIFTLSLPPPLVSADPGNASPQLAWKGNEMRVEYGRLSHIINVDTLS